MHNALYRQGATDKNNSSDRPLEKNLLIQTGNLVSGKASEANLRSERKGEWELARLPEQAVQRLGGAGGGVLYRRGNSRGKVPEEEESMAQLGN